MANKEIILTPEGRQKLVEELEYREGEKHDEIVERIKEARGFGDLSENAEYDAAKEEQSQNESPAGMALIGHVVGDQVSFNTPTGKVREYKIVNITR